MEQNERQRAVEEVTALHGQHPYKEWFNISQRILNYVYRNEKLVTSILRQIDYDKRRTNNTTTMR